MALMVGDLLHEGQLLVYLQHEVLIKKLAGPIQFPEYAANEQA